MKNVLGDKLAECSGIGVCKDLKCECPEGFSNACQNKDTMAVCSISNMGGVSTIKARHCVFQKLVNTFCLDQKLVKTLQ